MKETKGFTGIPNDLLEALFSVGLSANDMRVALAIVRYTYGFRREYAELSAQFLAGAVGLRRDVTGRCVRGLVKSGIVKMYKTETPTSPKKLGINTNFDEWLITPAVCKTASTYDSDANSYDDTYASTYDSDANYVYDTDDNTEDEFAYPESDAYANSTYDVSAIRGGDRYAHQDINNNKIINKTDINKTVLNKTKSFSEEIVRVKELFNLICTSFTPIVKIDSILADEIKLLLRDFTEEEIKQGFEMAEASPHLKGLTGKWKADFDWIINPSNMTKILNGKYKAKPSDPTFDVEEFFQAALRRGMED